MTFRAESASSLGGRPVGQMASVTLRGQSGTRKGSHGPHVSVTGGVYGCTKVWTHSGPGHWALPTCSRRAWAWGRGPYLGVCAHLLPSRQDWV